MLTSNRFLLAAFILGLAACAPAAPADSGVTGDSGTTPTDVVATDTASVVDTGNRVDAPVVTDTARDAPPATDANFGVCGQTTQNCLCMCVGGDQACQQRCIVANMSCLACVQGAQAMCCPAEDSATQDCVAAAQADSDAGPACTDQACVTARCMTQINAYNTCLRAQSPMAACMGYLARCLPGRCE